jgi:2-C-methyl-D-erythritol 4-phosphate cytidylyltransferase
MAVALLLAAGSGERLGANRPKAFVELAGRPLLQWSLDVLAGVREIERIVLALPQGLATAPNAAGSPDDALCLDGGAVELPHKALSVEGGPVRSASVGLALAAAGPGDPVLVHDAARPLLTAELVQRTLGAVAGEGIDAAIAAAPVTDTVKRAAGEPPIVTETLDRSGLWAVQTPQAFRREALERALDVPDEVLAQATDDAWLIERSGGRVAIVAAGHENLKVTTAVDFSLAELLLERRAAQTDASDLPVHPRDLHGAQGLHAD